MFGLKRKKYLSYALALGTVALLSVSTASAQTTKLYHGEYPGNRTFNSELNGTNLQTISSSGTGHLDVEVDKANGFVYWSAFNNNQIWRSRLDGSNSIVLHTTAGNPFGIDIDVAGGRVFAGHWSGDNIRCGNLDGTGAFNILLAAANNVTDVEFDEVNSFLYYNVAAGGGPQRGLWRVQIGAGCSTVGAPARIVADGGRPYGITIDVPNNFVYFTNAQFARVSRTSLTGAGTIFNFCSGGAPAGNWLTGIDLLNGTLYWNAYGSDRTYSSPAAACAVTTLNTSAMNRPWGLAAVEFNPAVSVEKSTNGADSDNPPGNNIIQGNAVTWDYQVTNTGDTVWMNNSLIDSDIGAVVTVTGGDTDGDGEIDPGETFNFQANGVAALGQYANTGTYSGTTDLNATDQLTDNDSDDSHYFGISPDVNPPVLLSFTSTTADNTYGPGANINITATYDELIAVGSSITIVLDNGVSVVLNTLAGATLSGTYTVGATGSGEDSGDLTVSSITVQSVDDLFGNTQSGTTVPAAPNNLGDSSNIVIDVTAPVLAEITPVPTPTTNQNPSYTFSSDEAGNITYGGGCNSVTGAAAVGNNPVVLDSNGAGGPLLDGAYSCTITVTDAVGNISNVLNMSAFTVDTSPPVLLSFTSTTADNTYGPGANINITATYNENVAVGSNLTVQLDNGVSVLLNVISGAEISGTYTVGITGSGQDSADLTVSSISIESVADGLGNTQTGSAVPGAPNNIADTSNIVIDVTAPILAEVTPVPSPTANQNPPYTYSSDEAGTAAFAGGCNSVTTATVVGNNPITLDSNGAGGPLAQGTYAACTVQVTDAVGNVSNLLAISTFEIEITPPNLLSFTSTTVDNTYGPGSAINITANYDEAIGAGASLTVTLDNGVNVLLNNVSGSTVFGTYNVGPTGSGEDSGDLTVSNIVSESVPDVIGNTQTGSAVPGSPNNIADTSNIVIDVTAPTLAEVTPAPTPTTNQNPPYTYSSDEAGTAAFGGGCNSVSTATVVGNNAIILDSDGAGSPLPLGVYNACTVAVTDAVGNTGNLNISTFVVAAPGPGGITSGLEMWFRADEDAYQDNGTTLATNGQTIQRWNDQSGNSFDALQNNSGRRPVLTTTTGTLNNFNPTVFFDGQNPNQANRDRMPILGKFYDNNSSLDQVYVYVAYKTDQDAEWAFIDFDRSEWYNINVQNNNQVQFNYRGLTAIRDNNVVIGNARDGLAHVTSYIYDNTLVNETLIRFDGQEVLSNNREPLGVALEDTTRRFGYIGDGSEATNFDSGANNIYYEGDISEIIVYENNTFNVSTQRRIESYLAIKYGVTLDASLGFYEDAGTNSVFNIDDGGNGGTPGDQIADWQDVAGIAMDTVATLDQRVSKSVNASAVLTVATDNDFTSPNDASRTAVTDASYLLWGHDGNSSVLTQTTDIDLSSYASRIQREWKFENNSVAQAVNFSFDALPPLVGAAQYRLLFDADGDFTAGAVLGGSSTTTTFTGITVPAGVNYMTIAFEPQPVLIEFDRATDSDFEASGGNIPQLLVLGSVTAPITVTILVTSPDAVPGTDYTIANTIIPVGSYDGTVGTAVPINLFIIDDGNAELLETLTLDIQDPAGPLNQVGDANSDLTTQDPSTYDIIDDDMGPGGVADRVLFWYRADIGANPSVDGVGVQTWFDQLTVPASVDATEPTANQRPTYEDQVADEINFNPVLRFDGVNDQLELPDTSFVNLSQTPFKVMHFVIQTGADVTTTQNIFEEGAGVRGFDAYIQNNELSFGAWNFANDGPGSPWNFTDCDLPIQANMIYLATVNIKGNNTSTGSIECWLTGEVSAAPGTNVGILYPHSGDTAIGTIDQTAIFDNGTPGGNVVGSGASYGGEIAEMVYYDDFDQDPVSRNRVESYLAIKYGLTLFQGAGGINYVNSINQVVYDAVGTHLTYNNDIAGISEDSATILSQPLSRSINPDALFTIGNATNHDDFEMLLWGNDDAATNVWTAVDAEIPIERIPREWRFDEQGDVGTVFVEIDAATLPAPSANFSYAVCVDADGDFTSGATHYPLSNTSGTIWSTNGVEPGGDSYFTICQYPTVPPEVAISIDLASIPEAAGVATITATPTYAWFSPITVNLVYSGTSEPADYTAAASIVIPARTANASITVTAVQDNIEEPDETVIVDVDTVVNATEQGVQQVTTTIIDDDPPPDVTLSVDLDPIAENGGVATFTATLSHPSEFPVTVDLAYSGTASNGTDYLDSGTQIVIPALSLSGSVTVTGQDDPNDEPNETVIVDITSVTNGNEAGGFQQQQTTITDDDPPPTVTLSVDLLNIPENGGVATVTATLNVISAFNVTVNLGFSGTATLGGDYNPSAVSIFIPAGSLTGTMTLNAVDDPDDDDAETIVVDITTIVNGTEVGVQQVTVVIDDDDATCNFDPWQAPTGTTAMVAMSADGTFDPMDPNFQPPSGNDFDTIIMGRTPAAALARRAQAFAYFLTTYGIDFNVAIQLNPSTWITPDGSVLLVYAMTDPRYNYKLNSISDVRLDSSGGDVSEAAYIMSVVNPAGTTLFGTYGGVGGVAVPEGTAALHGEIFSSVPIACSDASIDMQSFYMMYQSLEPVMANQQDKVIYNDEVVTNDRFVGTGFAFSRKGIKVLPSGTDFQAWVTNIVTFYP